MRLPNAGLAGADMARSSIGFWIGCKFLDTDDQKVDPLMKHLRLSSERLQSGSRNASCIFPR
jgi:hypothetical protein